MDRARSAYGKPEDSEVLSLHAGNLEVPSPLLRLVAGYLRGTCFRGWRAAARLPGLRHTVMASSVSQLSQDRSRVAAGWMPAAHAGAVKLAWFLWLVVFAALVVKPFRTHLAYAREHHPDLFAVFVLAAGATCVLAPVAYHRILRRWLWQYEPLVLAGMVLAAGLVYAPKACLALFWTAATAYVAGWRVLGWLGLQPVPGWSRLIYCPGLGFGLLLGVAMMLGLLGALKLAWVTIAWLALDALGWRGLRVLGRDLAELLDRWRACGELQHSLVSLVIPPAAVLVVTALLPVLAPSIAFDPLKVHLAAAQFYARTARLWPLPTEPLTIGPQGFELLLACQWLMGGQVAAQMLHPVFWVLALLVGARLARRWGASPVAVVVGTALAFAVPFAHWTGTVPKNDWFVAYFILLVLEAYFEWGQTKKFGWLVMGGFAAGVAASAKHTAFLGLVPLAGMYLWALWLSERGLGRVLKRVLVLCLVAAPLALFWTGRAAWLTGNPFYPFHPLEPRSYAGGDPGNFGHDKLLKRVITWPWRTHFEGKGWMGYGDNPLGMALVAVLPLAFLLRRRQSSREQRSVAMFLGLYFALWLVLFPILRFAIAALLLLFLFAAERLVAWAEFPWRVARWSVPAILASCLTFSLIVIWISEVNRPQLALFSFRTDEAGYLRKALRTYPSLEVLARYAGPADAVFAVDNCSRLYAPYPERFECAYIGWRPERTLRPLARRVQEGSWQFLILPNRDEAGAIRQAATPRYELKLLYQDEFYSLFGLTPRGLEAQGGPARP